ncbi:glycosyltransferase family 39 protein [Brevundimonas sp.]|uniref:ArnT family glycosyltransferase n=1 Tax=Brevundimonas sp. TaxID=1871086 RepID=UPI0025F3DB32|nr:glycosyltransferase family 39 protein [Brevundimonas sp.]
MRPASVDISVDKRGDAWRVALVLTLALTLARLVALFLTPLELYPDEAQYWLWSRDLAFGYYSKPPMLAWLIGLTTAIGGDGEAWVRLSSPLLHAGTGLILFEVGRRLHGPRVGLWSAVFYALMPGVQLSAGVASTDAPLLFFAALGLLAYVAFLAGPSMRLAAACGLAVGAAFLSKYAALYILLGVGLHLIWSPQARTCWTWGRALGAVAGLALVAAPNLVWNALNDFSTVSHTADNANWRWDDLFHPVEMIEFLASQLMVLGPVPFVLLILGAFAALRARASTPEADRLLLSLAVPPVLLVTVQALLSRANANWAVIAYAPAVVLVAAWLLRDHRPRLLWGAIAFQALVAVMVLVLAIWPPLADRIGLGGAFKRVRGWETSAHRILDAAEAQGPRTVVAADDRFLFNSLAYYGRDRLAGDDAPILRMWVREASANNQAEATSPLTPELGDRVLLASTEVRFRHEFVADFASFSGWRDVSVRLDPSRTRDVAVGLGRGFAPRPRDPVTGLPTPP